MCAALLRTCAWGRFSLRATCRSLCAMRSLVSMCCQRLRAPVQLRGQCTTKRTRTRGTMERGGGRTEMAACAACSRPARTVRKAHVRSWPGQPHQRRQPRPSAHTRRETQPRKWAAPRSLRSATHSPPRGTVKEQVLHRDRGCDAARKRGQLRVATLQLFSLTLSHSHFASQLPRDASARTLQSRLGPSALLRVRFFFFLLCHFVVVVVVASSAALSSRRCTPPS